MVLHRCTLWTDFVYPRHSLNNRAIGQQLVESNRCLWYWEGRAGEQRDQGKDSQNKPVKLLPSQGDQAMPRAGPSQEQHSGLSAVRERGSTKIYNPIIKQINKQTATIIQCSPDQCGSVDRVLSCRVKGCWLDSRSGHMPRLWADALVCARGSQSMFLSHIDVSLPLFLPPFPFL